MQTQSTMIVGGSGSSHHSSKVTTTTFQSSSSQQPQQQQQQQQQQHTVCKVKFFVIPLDKFLCVGIYIYRWIYSIVSGTRLQE